MYEETDCDYWLFMNSWKTNLEQWKTMKTKYVLFDKQTDTQAHIAIIFGHSQTY